MIGAVGVCVKLFAISLTASTHFQSHLSQHLFSLLPSVYIWNIVEFYSHFVLHLVILQLLKMIILIEIIDSLFLM